eukprot:scaffold72535_cov65-Phaeocystis_antarctica.AAC.8
MPPLAKGRRAATERPHGRAVRRRRRLARPARDRTLLVGGERERARGTSHGQEAHADESVLRGAALDDVVRGGGDAEEA